MKPKVIITFFILVCICSSCAIGPVYSPELSLENSGLDMRERTVVVSKFYKAQTELSYSGDLTVVGDLTIYTSRILKTEQLNDISWHVANYLSMRGIKAYGVEDASVDELKKGEVMLSGSIIMKSIPMEDNFPFPGMLVVCLIGNILPSPAAYKSGIDVIYQYELIDTTGRILFHSSQKRSRIYYKDYYIWGRIFNYKKYEKKISDNLQNQIYDLIVDDLFR